MRSPWVPFKQHLVERYYRSGVTRLAGPDVTRPDGRCLLPPKWLILGINNVCNLHCKMCDVGLGDPSTAFWANLIGSDPRNMQPERFYEVLRQARGFHPRPRVALVYTEPLIHPNILEFTRAVVDQGFSSSITTNGTQLPRLAEALVESGLQELSVSIDGPLEVHNRIRGGRETFQKIFRGLELLNATKLRLGTSYPRLTFSFTITDENYRHILEFVQAVEPLRPERIYISQLNFITEAMAAAHNAAFGDRFGGELKVTESNVGSMNPAEFEVGAILEEIGRVRAWARAREGSGPAVSFSPSQVDEPLLETYYRQPMQFVGGRHCSDPFELMMIRTDGSVIPAQGRCFNLTVGRIDEEPLPAIWNGERFRAFRRTLQGQGGTLPACARCCGVIGKSVDAEPAHRA